jgi:hypothetical protein
LTDDAEAVHLRPISLEAAASPCQPRRQDEHNDDVVDDGVTNEITNRQRGVHGAE